MALVSKLENRRYRTFVIIGDGECDEGSTWECALFANQYKLNNLVVIVDSNKMQAMGNCDDVLSLTPFGDKWRSFGWNVKEIDGHNHEELIKALSIDNENRKPTVVIANTTKGKGISFMENNIIWHYRNPSDEEYEKAVKELEEEI